MGSQRLVSLDRDKGFTLNHVDLSALNDLKHTTQPNCGYNGSVMGFVAHAESNKSASAFIESIDLVNITSSRNRDDWNTI